MTLDTAASGLPCNDAVLFDVALADVGLAEAGLAEVWSADPALDDLALADLAFVDPAFVDFAFVDPAFVDLVLADEDLLRSEFEAIVAAGWSAPPQEPVADGGDAEKRGGGQHPTAPGPRGSRSTSTGRRAGYTFLRQRSPPGQPGGEPAIPSSRHSER